MTSRKKEVAPAQEWAIRGDHEDLSTDKGGSYPANTAATTQGAAEANASLGVKKTADWPDALIPAADIAEVIRHCNLLYAAEDTVLLVALDPDGKAHPEATAHSPGHSRDSQIAAWVKRMTKLRRNLYVQPNPVRDIKAVFARIDRKAAPMKATLTNTLEARWLTLDIDPRAVEDHAEEQARIHALVSQALPTPGALRGLNRLEGRPLNARRSEGDACAAMHELLDQAPSNLPSGELVCSAVSCRCACQAVPASGPGV